jgi:hypothetical protein
MIAFGGTAALLREVPPSTEPLAPLNLEVKGLVFMMGLVSAVARLAEFIIDKGDGWLDAVLLTLLRSE